MAPLIERLDGGLESETHPVPPSEVIANSEAPGVSSFRLTKWNERPVVAHSTECLRSGGERSTLALNSRDFMLARRRMEGNDTRGGQFGVRASF